MTPIEELRQRIASHARGLRTPTAIPGLTVLRADAATMAPIQSVYTPMVCVIAQGRKRVHLAHETFEYDASRYLVSSIDLPVRSAIVDATPDRPYLALSLALDVRQLGDVLIAGPRPGADQATSLGIGVTALSPDLLDAFVRLLRLLDRPADVPSLAPLVLREIFYRLLGGEHGPALRQLALGHGRAAPIARVIDWIRANYAQPFSARDLQRIANMSAPSLHRHFKAATALSPLQYQKQIRLQEARRLLVTQEQDAATVGFAVGYGSPSQFSREYARLFGAPPRQDAQRLRAGAAWTSA